MTPAQGRPTEYVRQMLRAATQLNGYVANMHRDSFRADAKTQDAVLMKLLVIGELAAKLIDGHAEFVALHSGIPWYQMKGMRNRMAHGYFELDLDIVWDTAITAIPKLECDLIKLASGLD